MLKARGHAVIEEMPRPRPQYLHAQRTRHDKLVWYFRRPGGKRIRIRAAYGTKEFEEQYLAALQGVAAPAPSTVKSGSLQWLWDRYRETVAWTHLSRSTRKARETIMRPVLANSGKEPCASIRRSDVVAGRDRRAASSAHQARTFLDAMRGLFRWAVQAYPDHVRKDPTEGVKNPAPPKTLGFAVWSDDDVEQYQRTWPVGTKERVWLDVLLYTGLRRGDAVRLGRQHIKDGVATIRTEKSGGQVVVAIPVLPVLSKTLQAGPCGDLAFICGDRGKPLTKEAFGNMFRQACYDAGLRGRSAHGLRKAGATRAAENGATVTELEAIFGWTGGGMASLYTRSADRKRAAARAMGLMDRTPAEQSMPSPSQQVRTSDEKKA